MENLLAKTSKLKKKQKQLLRIHKFFKRSNRKKEYENLYTIFNDRYCSRRNRLHLILKHFAHYEKGGADFSF